MKQFLSRPATHQAQSHVHASRSPVQQPSPFLDKRPATLAQLRLNQIAGNNAISATQRNLNQLSTNAMQRRAFPELRAAQSVVQREADEQGHDDTEPELEMEEQSGVTEDEATGMLEEGAPEAEETMEDEDSEPLQAKSSPSAGPVQLMSDVKNRGQNYTYLDKTMKSVKVGSDMEAWLDPTDKLTGESASVNTGQDSMMASIRKKWKINGGGVVKGHLLNDNLGGQATNDNLYPITRAANSDHLGYVENQVKTRVWTQNLPTYYRVKVKGTPSFRKGTAAFDCRIHAWNGQPGKIGAAVSSITVNSDLASIGRYHAISSRSKGIKKPQRFKNPKRPSSVRTPLKNRGGLTKKQRSLR